MVYACEISGTDIVSSTHVPLDAYTLFRGELELVIRQCLTEPVCCTAEVVNENTGEVVIGTFSSDSIAEAEAEAVRRVMAIYDQKKSA